jgi:hypothetical protein
VLGGRGAGAVVSALVESWELHGDEMRLSPATEVLALGDDREALEMRDRLERDAQLMADCLRVNVRVMARGVAIHLAVPKAAPPPEHRCAGCDALLPRAGRCIGCLLR